MDGGVPDGPGPTDPALPYEGSKTKVTLYPTFCSQRSLAYEAKKANKSQQIPTHFKGYSSI